MDRDTFERQLAMPLQDKPTGTTAEPTDYIVAYLRGGREVVYSYLRDDRSAIDEEVDLDDLGWQDIGPRFRA